MEKNKIIELILIREKHYLKITEKLFQLFSKELKQGMEEALYDGKNLELYVNDIGLVPQNFRFARIEGKIAKHDIGEKIHIDDTKFIEITLDNFWDFADTFTIIIPVALLDEPEVSKIAKYLKLVKENDGQIPENLLNANNIKKSKAMGEREFVQVAKELDEAQLLALKLLKSNSVH